MTDLATTFPGRSPAILRLREQIQRHATFIYPLCIQGERGTGKRRVAEAVRQLGPHACRPLFRIDASLPGWIFPDRKQLQDGGVVLFEEIGQADGEFQATCWKWLRATKDLGESLRVLSTCSVSLGSRVARNEFRPDLYLHLRMTGIELAPLRERREDIPYLLREFLAEAAKQLNEGPKIFTAEAMDWILEFPWPGNIAQLRKEVLRAVAGTPGKTIGREAMGPDLLGDPDEKLPTPALPLSERIREFEEQEIRKALDQVGGLRDRAAALLGIDRRTLQRKLRKIRKIRRKVPQG